MYVISIVWITLKRMARSWQVMGGLLGGLVLASGIMAAIAIYSTASLQKSFQQDWQLKDEYRPPFSVILSRANLGRQAPFSSEDLLRLESAMSGELPRRVGLPSLSFVQYASLGDCSFTTAPGTTPGAAPGESASPGAPGAPAPADARTLEIDSMSNLQALAGIVDGRWFQPRSDGVVEVVVDETTLESSELLVGQRYLAWYKLQDKETVAGSADGYLAVPVEVVGFFAPRPGHTTRDWIYLPPYRGRAFALPDVLRGQLLGERGLRAERFDMLWVFDAAAVPVAELDRTIAGLEAAGKTAASVVPGTAYWLSPLDFFREFSQKARKVSLFLVALAAPVLGMVIYFIVLMAGLSVEHRRKEIVVMFSRGAGRFQVIVSFLLEWLILGGLALAAGPFVGLFMTHAMGASAGFLSFVNREPIPAAIGPQSWLFSLAASLVAAAAGMAPVFTTVRQTVVTWSRRPDRKRRRSIFHRFFLDVVFLVLAAVAARELMWQSTKLAPDETAAADPILFFVPVLFLLGAGLLLLRVYPLVLGVLRAAAGRMRGVVWQVTLRRLTRTAPQYFPLLLLLMLTLSLGIYSASAARTLARNFEDSVHYTVGADVLMTESWEPPAAAAPGPQLSAGHAAETAEPPFLMRMDLPGVQDAARVLRKEVDAAIGGAQRVRTSGTMLAVAPEEFARTAWFRGDFAAASLASCMGLLARHADGMLVSAALFKEKKLSLGEPAEISDDGQIIETYIAGVVSFWPTLDPLREPFFILTLDHVQEDTRLEPYQVWYKMKAGADVQALVDALPGLGVYPTKVWDARALTASLRQEPYRMGFSGILSIAFIVSSLVTVLGYIVFTYFSVRGRLVQFGSLRAMGFSRAQLVASIGLEQLLTVGIGLGMATGLGALCSRLFLPFLRDRASGIQKVPPFLIVADRADVLFSLAFLLSMFALAATILLVVLARMRVDRALRMGEEE